MAIPGGGIATNLSNNVTSVRNGAAEEVNIRSSYVKVESGSGQAAFLQKQGKRQNNPIYLFMCYCALSCQRVSSEL